MDHEQIQELIAIEIREIKDLENIFKFDVRSFLIKPIQQSYLNFDSTERYILWTVYEESKDGYKIYFNDEINAFGLGIISENNDLIDIGIYGTILETLETM